MFDINGKDNSTYNIENIELIKKASPKVGEFIEKEYYRQKNNVELIASENYCSEAVLAACGQLPQLEICRRVSICEDLGQYKPLLRRNRICRSARRICLRRMEKSLRYGLSCECTASQRISG